MSKDRNLYKRGGTYYARVKVAGRDQRRSLRTGSKAVALKKLRKILGEVDHVREHGHERHTGNRHLDVVGARGRIPPTGRRVKKRTPGPVMVPKTWTRTGGLKRARCGRETA